jgi:hypothetical protein
MEVVGYLTCVVVVVCKVVFAIRVEVRNQKWALKVTTEIVGK